MTSLLYELSLGCYSVTDNFGCKRTSPILSEGVILVYPNFLFRFSPRLVQRRDCQPIVCFCIEGRSILSSTGTVFTMRVLAPFTITAAVGGWTAEEALAAEPLGASGRKLADEELGARNEAPDGRTYISPLGETVRVFGGGEKLADEEREGEVQTRVEDVRKEYPEAEDADQRVETPSKKEDASPRPSYTPRSVGYYLHRRAQKRKKKRANGKKCADGGKKNVHPLVGLTSGCTGEP
ncbi:hypothetical protein Esti_002165 [Eimeria stiedai]